jgi:hypothetical protein
VLDQHATPTCVAYSSSAMKAWQDKRDQERFFDFDEPTFFGEIGGTSAGAHVRAAMERMRRFGYPVAGSGDAGNHRIAAYYAVPRDLATIKAAILADGRGLGRPADHLCHRCRDSCVAHVATQEIGRARQDSRSWMPDTCRCLSREHPRPTPRRPPAKPGRSVPAISPRRVPRDPPAESCRRR